MRRGCKRWNKNGQVTVFIIIAIVIVGLGILGYMLYPKIKSTLGIGAQSPTAYIQSCIEDNIKGAVEKISLQGGSVKPEVYYTFDDENIGYLCYTNEMYKSCVVQQPNLKQHIESEIKTDIEDEVGACFELLKDSYENRGYGVQLTEGIKRVELLPNRIISTFNYSLTLTKGSTEKYDSFAVILNNNLYELVSIANSILEWESYYGKAEINTYMYYYPNIKVVLNPRDDGTNIYVVSHRNSKELFQFASRSLVSSVGGGL